MPSNCVKVDEDLVWKTWYKVSSNCIAKKRPLKPWLLPKFKPLHIDNWDTYSTPNLPSTVNRQDPFNLFSLFFMDEIMDKLIE